MLNNCVVELPCFVFVQVSRGHCQVGMVMMERSERSELDLSLNLNINGKSLCLAAKEQLDDWFIDDAADGTLLLDCERPLS